MKRFIVVLLAAILTLGTVTAFAAGSPTPAPTPAPAPVIPGRPSATTTVTPGRNPAPAPVITTTVTPGRNPAVPEAATTGEIKEMTVITLDNVEEIVDSLLDKLPGEEVQAEAMKSAYAALADPNGTVSVAEFVSILTDDVKTVDGEGKTLASINLDDYDFTSKRMNHVVVDTSKKKSKDGRYSISFAKTDLPDQLNADTINDMLMMVYDYSAGQNGEMIMIQLDKSMLSDTVPATLTVTVPCEEFDFTFIVKK